MKNTLSNKNTRYATVLSLLMILFGCVQEPVLWDVSSEQQVISDYIADNDQYTEFGKLLESAGLNSLLRVRGPYTLFLPDNDAMAKYYQEKGTSFDQMSAEDRKTLVYNHLILNEIQASDFGLGALRDTNAIGDYLVTEFQGADIIINKQSRIIDRDIRTANGYIHQVEKVIDPITIDIFNKLKEDPQYSLFTKGLEVTGLKDTLQLIKSVYGVKNGVDQYMRTRFTILAVPDKIFADSLGITTIEQLIAHFTDRPDSITYKANPFYRYMEYHCMGGTYFLSEFKSGTNLYPILSSDNNISITIEEDYKLNLDKKTKLYTGFDIENSNVPAKNGAIHKINNLLPVIQPEPTLYTFDTTDYPEIKQGDFYGKYYMKWFDGQNTFPKVKWRGDYLQYYYKNHDAPVQLNYDCWNMNGFWEIEITTPKIMKGKYSLSGYVWSGNIDFEVYVDGVKYATIKRNDPDRAPWGEVTWTRTEEHKIKLVNLSWGTLFWDTVIFTPAK
ncbi:MAG TPA: fasciclin domain-containing protein [Prolixibacteraceae bacterium]|nr:fasciclin domain-containing protein [Prolixibacteraceae bacterium]